jgi:hypothetical protein
MKLNRPLTIVAYTIAALMIFVPLVEVVLSVWPLRVGQTSWRFGAVGLLSQAIMTPLLGFLLIVLASVFHNHWRTLQITAVVAAFIALILLIVLPLFALDTIQMRAQVRPQAHRAYDLSATMAALKLAATLGITGLLAVGAWKASRENRKRSAPTHTDTPLLARTRG